MFESTRESAILAITRGPEGIKAFHEPRPANHQESVHMNSEDESNQVDK